MVEPYRQSTLSHDDATRSRGPLVLQFGTNSCGYCITAEPTIARALAARPDVRVVKVEDGRGRPLGRAFFVKLWPTLVFLQDGQELSRVVRPKGEAEVSEALSLLPKQS